MRRPSLAVLKDRRKAAAVGLAALAVGIAVPVAARAVPVTAGVAPVIEEIKLYAVTPSGDRIEVYSETGVSLAHSVLFRSKVVDRFEVEGRAAHIDQAYKIAIRIDADLDESRAAVFYGTLVEIKDDGEFSGSLDASKIEAALPAGDYEAHLIVEADDGWELLLAKFDLTVTGDSSQHAAAAESSEDSNLTGVAVDDPESELTLTPGTSEVVTNWGGKSLPPEVAEELQERADRYFAAVKAARDIADSGTAVLVDWPSSTSSKATIQGWVRVSCQVSRLHGNVELITLRPGQYENLSAVYSPSGVLAGYAVTTTVDVEVKCLSGKSVTIPAGTRLVLWSNPDAAANSGRITKVESGINTSVLRACQAKANQNQTDDYCRAVFERYCSSTPHPPSWCCMQGYATKCRPRVPPWPSPWQSVLDYRVALSGFSLRVADVVGALLIAAAAYILIKRRR